MKKSLIGIPPLCFLLAAACHKESSTTYSSTGDFFSKNQSVAQKFSLLNSTGAVIQTSRGTKIHFPENAFVNIDNTPVGGQVNIEVKEILTPMEMILNQMPSTSFYMPLESGGEYFIGATAGNKEMKLAMGKKIQIELPPSGASMDAMKVFTGYTWGADSVYGSARQSWVANADTANSVRPTSINAYSMFCDSIKWVNCDRTLPGKRISYTVNAGNGFSPTDMHVFIHLSGLNTVVQMYEYIGSNSYYGSLIEGPATVIGICIKNGELYSSITKVSLQDGQSCTLNYVRTDENSLKATLSALK